MAQNIKNALPLKCHFGNQSLSNASLKNNSNCVFVACFGKRNNRQKQMVLLVYKK